MTPTKPILIICALGLAACDMPAEGAAPMGDGDRAIRNVPEEIVQIAAPFQDLNTVVLRADNCYWYAHAGPVETTLLPLRSAAGRPICAGPPPAADA